MNSNMQYRQYLTRNANKIIDHNKNAAKTNCSDYLTPINSLQLPSLSVIHNSISYNNNPINNSDLKQNYLNKTINSNNISSLGIRYN